MNRRRISAPGLRAGRCLALLLGLAASAARAEGIEIDGQITGAGGRPLAGAVVELRPLPGPWETATAQLEGQPRQPPAARVRTNTGGGFRLEVPAAGLWRVIARHPKHLAMRCDLAPLVEPEQLPAVALPRREQRTVTTLDIEGRPVAGVRVAVDGWLPETNYAARLHWRPQTRHGTSDEDGRLTLPGAAKEIARVAALSGEAFAYETPEGGSGDLEVRLTSLLLAARLVDAEGRPVPGLAALVTPDLALGWTGPEGELRVPYSPRGGVSSLILAGELGLAGTAGSKERPGEKPLVLRLPPVRELHGRVLDAASREPLAGAWVGSTGDFRQTVFQQTGPRGSFRLLMPAARRPRVEAVAAGYLKQSLAVPAEDEPDELTIALAPSLAITGRVTGRDGSGLAGVELVALPDRASPKHRRRQMLDTPWPAGQPRQAQAGSLDGGRFRLTGLKPGIDHQLRASHRGYAPRRLVVPATASGAPPPAIEIVLTPGIAAFGVVLDDAEQPVAGAGVGLFIPPSQVSRLRSFGELSPDRVVTGTGGRFDFSDLAPGSYLLRVDAPGLVPLSLPGVEIPAQDAASDGGTIDLGRVLLERGVALAGRVTDDGGRGIEGARVSVSSLRHSQELEPAPRTAISGTDGAFAVEGVSPSASINVSAWAEGYQHLTLTTVTIDRQEPLVIVLEPSVTVRGRVLDARGEGAGHARVQLHRVSAGGGTGTTSLGADGDGYFVFEAVAPGKATLFATSPDGVADPLEIEILAREQPELRIVLRPAAAVRGTLADPDGVPVIEARIRLAPLRPGVVDYRTRESSQSVATGAGGRFAFAGVKAGDYRVSAEHPDFEPMRQLVSVEAGVRELELAFETRRDREALTASGRVIDPRGDAVDGATVTLVGNRPSPAAEATSSGGGFELQAEEPGTYAVLVEHPDFAQQRTAPFELGDAPIRGLEVRLEGGGSVSGRILGLDLPRLSQLEVSAVSGRLGRRAGQVRQDGSYRVPNLAAGDWHLRARVGNLGRMVRQQVRLGGPGDAVEVDLVFEQGFSLRGLALRDGEPWRDARAELTCREPQHLYWATVQSGGRFLFEDVLGSCRLKLTDTSAGSAVAHRQLEITADDEIIVDVATAAIAGRVLTAGDLTPLAAAAVELHPAGTNPRGLAAASVATSATGHFDLRPVSQGPWRLRIATPGYVTAETAIEVPSDELEVLLTPAVPAILIVVDANGVAVRQVSIVVSDADRQPIAYLSYRPDAAGRVVLDNLPAGTWTVHVRGGGAKAEVELQVPGDPVWVVLRK